jgi:hypothetical protein
MGIVLAHESHLQHRAHGSRLLRTSTRKSSGVLAASVPSRGRVELRLFFLDILMILLRQPATVFNPARSRSRLLFYPLVVYPLVAIEDPAKADS